MCGLAGFFDAGATLAVAGWPAVLGHMGGAILHRGPDDAGVWSDPEAGIGLVHRRLSVLDLTPAGHQPMLSASGRYVLAFNGEIYNHLELRRELGLQSGIAWRGHSDTETLLAGFETWGLEATLKKSIGMFAMALWDRAERTLVLARDRMGEKPLYYGWQNGVFLFGSELKALKAHPAFRGGIDRDALTLLLRYGYIAAPHSIYQGIRKLPAGSFLRLAGDALRMPAQLADPVTYWLLREAVRAGRDAPFHGSETQAITALETRLKDSISLQMIADVPLGAFLSGGVDSSMVVALMQAQSARPVRTFTIGFHEAEFNEAGHAQAIARHLGTDHTELYVTPREAMDVIPRLPALYDEPFADSSQVPTFLVSRLARQHVTVSLSGDGGDELFGGYTRYSWAAQLRRRQGVLPQIGRAAFAKLLMSLTPTRWDALFARLAPLLPDRWAYKAPGDKLHKLAEALAFETPEQLYLRLLSHWGRPAEVVAGAAEPATALNDPASWREAGGFEAGMMYLDSLTYLPDNILVKVDRAAMGISLETRVPLLDHRVVEFAWQLPLSMKIRNGQGKWILRQVLEKYVPRYLFERPKMGFGVPIDSWLRGPLRDWAEALLDDSRLRREGYFHPQPIREKWAEHLSGQRNWQYYLWDVLMFQAWLEQNES
jgi:asparagine synthase (glutamine-hydrolysing)